MIKSNDWKDVVNGFYDKCFSMTVLIVLFAFIVFPNVETHNIRVTERVIEAIEIPQEIREQIEQPVEAHKPIFNIVIDEGDSDEAIDESIEVVKEIPLTTFDPKEVFANISTTTRPDTPRWVAYEDAPTRIQYVEPVYSEFARRAKIEGTVTLDIEVLSDGSIGAIEVYKSVQTGPGGLDESAVAAARQWKYQPALSGGKPVACWLKQNVRFSLVN